MNGGIHILLDFIVDEEGVDALRDEQWLRGACNQAASAARATVLHNFWHTFGVEGGVTGVVVLAESHITVHTYPESLLASFDVYMCGKADPQIAIESLLRALGDGVFKVKTIKRRNDFVV